jgi:ATP-dependent DNA ligase
MPSDTMLDGELVAFDYTGHTSFSLLQNYKRAKAQLAFMAFDILMYKGRDLRKTPLKVRREYLKKAMPSSDTVHLSECFQGNAKRLLKLAEEHSLEGVVAKRLNSIYESDRTSGAWSKYRISQTWRQNSYHLLHGKLLLRQNSLLGF